MPPPLPLELYYLIIQHVHNKPELCSLALCCSVFQDEAQRSLFRNVEPISYLRQKQFLSAINGAPLRLGPLVYTLSVDEWGQRDPDRLASLSAVFLAMCNLKHLKLRWWKPSTILQGWTFQLRSFSSLYYLKGPEMAFLLHHFLPTQRGIKHLEIHRGNPPDEFEAPMDLCPGLEFLALQSKRLVTILLPNNRLIAQFEWLNDSTPLPLTIIQLNYLTSLKFSLRVSGDTDTYFSPHLTSLLKLELYIAIREPNIVVNNLRFLQHIPRLQNLVINFRNLHSLMVDDVFYLKFSASFQLAFSLCPRLNHIDVTYDHTSGKFTRLVRQKAKKNGVWAWTREPVYLIDAREWRYVA